MTAFTLAPGLKALSTLMLLAVYWLAVPACAAGAIEVKVGAAHFPPYTVRPEQGADIGLLPQLVAALNRAQQRYRFVLVPTSIQRRFSDLQQGRTDMAIFENPQWGWEQIPHQQVDMGLEDAEVFVARQVDGRAPHYFDDLKGKRLALFNGYHYAFAGFNADPRYLRKAYNATLTYSHDSNLLMVQAGRADIALVTRSYLSDFLARNPSSRAQLVASQRIDQVYHHYALLRPAAPIGERSFAELLRGLRDSGELARIFQPYRIAVSAPED
ncbi:MULTISPECIES: transporter substrate-binding domain-containing protein [Pseudomonas]|uniref:Transporter substrate-binding domain-containing protein n=1 Tax=Pseudomonas juntendi TaxID=2666183 RepID=A0AAJ5S569_9PSED|nr:MULTISPECIES: transporter substrate-binding domain-containing protein [Pseudomonas]MDH1549380.1 transporter substrate-binding domain-containing protein [Pseudomonas juntendi]MDM3891288.1 transporter substrate-binding domain-containing protein [Pseudomonas juntendi]QOH70323.1 transporter substrate-binding domain-containing protein [Pseudomonas putida]WEA22260.1 transporter substrate-binding domain-containing protein [Pseudomonas juntendi]